MIGLATENVPVNELEGRCKVIVAQGGRMQFAYACRPPRAAQAELRYVVQPSGGPLRVWQCRPEGAEVPSLATIAPLLSWYEREMTDLGGVRFKGVPEPEALALLPGASVNPPPLTTAGPVQLRYEAEPTILPQLAGPDGDAVQTLPFGPVRADVLESGQFLFYYIGEAILHYHPQLFFKHRGMEKRFEGVATELGAVLAERVSAVGSVAHALSYCRAVEALSDCQVPQRARWLRVLLAELERLHNHLHYLGHLCHTTTLKVGEAQGKYLEELAKQLNGQVTGSRFLRGMLHPGGLRREPILDKVLITLDRVQSAFEPYGRMLEASTTHLDRLITTGQLTPRMAFDQGATGPIERASGLDRDPRRDLPYEAYEELSFKVAVQSEGDAHARQQVRIAEIAESFALIRQVVARLPRGPISTSCEPEPNSEGMGWVEGARGSLFYAVHTDDRGRLARVKIKSPSFSNWRVFPFTVHDSNMMDYAINEASFGLTIAGCDR